MDATECPGCDTEHVYDVKLATASWEKRRRDLSRQHPRAVQAKISDAVARMESSSPLFPPAEIRPPLVLHALWNTMI